MKSHILITLILSLTLVGLFSNSYAEVGDFVTSFDGSDDGVLFVTPFGVAVDSDGRIIVSDGGPDLVQIFGANGGFIDGFDGRGVGATTFDNPLGVAVDSNNRIIVGDINTDTVQIYDSNGVFVASLTGDTPFTAPFGIGVDSNNRIIVADAGTAAVQIFDPEGVFVASLTGDTPFNSPFGVAVDSNNRIIVSDNAADLVQIFDPEGDYVASIDGTTNGATAFQSPRGVAVDSNNRIIVVDSDLRLVQIFDPEGGFLDSFDGTTNGGTEFANPIVVAVDSEDRIIVTDNTLDNVQIFDHEGNFVVSFDGTSLSTPFVTPYGVAVDSDDRIIVTDIDTDLIQIFDSAGGIADSFDGTANGGTAFVNALAVAVDSGDRIIAVDNTLDLIQIFDPEGNFVASLTGGTPFTNPYGAAVDSGDRIIVIDAGSDLVQIFDPEGNFVDSFDGAANGGTAFANPLAVAVDSGDRIIVADNTLDNVQIFDPEGNFVASLTGGTAFTAPFGVAVDSGDRIIVADITLDNVQIFNPSGAFVASFDGSDGTAFETAFGIAVNSDNRIIVTDLSLDNVQIFEGFALGAPPADTTPPEIELNGANPQIIIQDDPYSELGATCTDGIDGDISITPDATAVDTATVGDYEVTYDCADIAGNDAIQVIRTVSVVAPVDNTSAPGIPTNLFVTPGAGIFTLTWDAPIDDGGSPITDYIIIVEDINEVDGPYTFDDGINTELSVIVTDVNSSGAYKFQVSAVNAIGTGPSVVDDNFKQPTSAIAPGTPTDLTATPGNQLVALTWIAPTFDDIGAPITDYLVEYFDTEWRIFSHSSSTDTSIIVTSLINGDQYDFRVSAVNVIGPGTPTNSVNATPVPDTTPPVIELDGADPQIIIQDDPYSELGATCTDGIDGDISITPDATAVDTATVGDYEVTYDCADIAGNDAIQVIRTVSVVAPVDTTPPVIELDGADPQIIIQDDQYSELGATCTDGIDGDISITPDATAVDTATVGDYEVTYDCADIAGNDAIQVIRTVSVVAPVDTTPPVIELDGADPQIIIQDDPYSELGATCTDGIDGDISITPDATAVDTATVGDYEVTYDCADIAGNDAIQVIRTVSVVAPVDTTPPVITLNPPNPQIIELGVGYDELGATTDDGSAVIIDDSAFVDTVGSYDILYDSVDAEGNDAITVIRTVEVVDTTLPDTIPPVITLNPPNLQTIEYNSAYSELGATCTDETDGDISITPDASAVDTATVGDYEVTYDCADIAGNDAIQVIRIVNVVDTVPVPVTLVDGDTELNHLNRDAPLELDLSGLSEGAANIPIIPAITITTDDVGISFGARTGITGFGGSNEILLIQDSTKSPDGFSSVSAKIEIGDPGRDLTLDQPVRIALFDQAGNTPFYINAADETFLITTPCGTDDFGIVDALLLFPIGECFIDVDDDLIIWTIHFSVQGAGILGGDNDAPSTPKKSGGGCSDCTPPTLGLDKDGKRLVDNGFTYNGESISVEKWHTPYPLINATVGEINNVQIKVFENGGINNMDIIQFGLGAKEIGEPLNELEVLIEVHLETFGIIEDIGVDKIVIIDPDNLIENKSVLSAASVVKCQASDIENRCVQVYLNYSYREATLNNVMVVSVIDKKHNEQSFYFNDGVQAVGDSMNPTPYVIISNKKSNQQTENLTLVLFRTDKVDNIWIDGNGIEYLQVSESRFDRITPIASIVGLDGFKVNQDAFQNVYTRSNSNFDFIVNYEKIRAVEHFDSSKIQSILDDPILSDFLTSERYLITMDKNHPEFYKILDYEIRRAMDKFDSSSITSAK